MSGDALLHEHFEDLDKQRHAARLGMWIFIGSELLLFSALFMLFVSYRAHYAQGFAEAVHHNTKVSGSINTGILLLSSAFAASATHAAREGRRLKVAVRLLVTIALGAAFLALKFHEYGIHLGEGIYPGGRSSYFHEHGTPGLAPFWTLYWIMTGLHAVHVVVGMSVLGVVLLLLVRRRTVVGPMAHRVEIAVLYWHLVDVIWIFLWPLFYLT